LSSPGPSDRAAGREGVGQKKSPSLREGQGLRWIPEALGVSGLTHISKFGSRNIGKFRRRPPDVAAAIVVNLGLVGLNAMTWRGG
jgi:hypothetical protein